MIVVTYHLTVETKHFLARGSQWVGDGSHKTREIIHILWNVHLRMFTKQNLYIKLYKNSYG